MIKMKIAKILKVETLRPSGQIQVHVKCPICFDKHVHGAGTTLRPQEIEGSTKMSHCLHRQCETYKLENEKN